MSVVGTNLGRDGSQSWNPDAAEFLALLAQDRSLWLADWRLKYLTLRIDTRDGAFLLFDRDGVQIAPEQLREAINGRRREGP